MPRLTWRLGSAALAPIHYNQRCGKRPERLADVAADLKQRLCQAMSSAGGHARDARGFRMKHR